MKFNTLYLLLHNARLIFSILRLLPHWIIYNLYGKTKNLYADVMKNLTIRQKIDYGLQYGFLYLMTFQKSFRNIFYFRTGHIGGMFRFLCKPVSACSISVDNDELGGGFVIYHGFSTVILAKSIGENFTVYQDVTVGSYGGGDNKPIIGKNVTIYAGAKVFGNIVVGDNVIIGANSVVSKSIFSNQIVAGIPAHTLHTL
jgi:serine O-acetyltransferase